MRHGEYGSEYMYESTERERRNGRSREEKTEAHTAHSGRGGSRGWCDAVTLRLTQRDAIVQ